MTTTRTKTTILIPPRFAEAIKNGTKEHLVISDDEWRQLFPLPLNPEIKKKETIIFTDALTSKEICRKELLRDGQKRIHMSPDGGIGIAYTSTFYWPIEDSELRCMLKGDNFKTKQEMVAFYIRDFEIKEMLYLDKSMGGILFTWGGFHKRLNKITDTKPVDKFKKYWGKK